MADIVTTPAQNPAAPATANPQQGNTPNAAEVHKAEMDRLKGLTAEAQWENGRVAGYQAGCDDGAERTVNRFKAILAACPGAWQMAAEAFLAKQTPEAVKMAFDSTNAALLASAERERAKDLEIARLKQLNACGGYPGGIGIGVTAGSGVVAYDPDEPMDNARATAQAEREWDTQPAVRRTAKSKEVYVLARAAELDGTHRSFAREPANA